MKADDLGYSFTERMSRRNDGIGAVDSDIELKLRDLIDQKV